jgi:hypothetical protein
MWDIWFRIATENRSLAMFRPIFALTTLAFAATAAGASSYSATPAVPTTDRFVTRDIIWSCGPAACQGATEESRPLVLCQALAKRAGRIDSFLADGRALSASDLERCNALAKPQPGKALAAQ